MQKAVNIMNKIAMILSIISIITFKQIKNGKASIVMGVLNLFLTWGANVILGLPVLPVLLIVLAILNKKLAAQEVEEFEEYADEVEELVEE